ncbi:MAG TPA: DUF4381 domain-containing protein [Gallionella sp.]|nr:DUF4381 domain-containing protein [Gallionella sp.]
MGGVTPDWLAQLAPEHAPPAPGWWPPAPGWWILLVLSALIIAYIVYRQFNPTLRLKRAALRQLKILESTATDNSVLARDLEHLLRRYAVARFGHEMVAGLSGEKWVAFVIEHGASAWTTDAGTNLLRAAYGGTASVDRTVILSGARAFLKRK